MLVQINDNEIFWAETEKQILCFLQSTSWSETHNLKEFMQEVAHRAKIQTGKTFRTDTVKNLVEDLTSAELIHILPVQ